MESDLCKQLRAVLSRHQIPLQQVPQPQVTPQEQSFFDQSRLHFLTRLLEEDNTDDEKMLLQLPQLQKSYKVLLTELTNIVNSPSSPKSCSSFSPSAMETSPPLAPELFSPPSPLPSPPTSAEFHALLLDCARAVAANNSAKVHDLVREIRAMAAPQSRPIERVALYFSNALVARQAGCGAEVLEAMHQEVTRRQNIAIRFNLPSLRATERFANQMILEACREAKRIHIVDYGIFYGDQWPSLIKALSERPEGPPLLKITGIDMPAFVNVEQTGNRLVDYAQSCGMHLEFHPIPATAWETVQPRYHLFHELLFVNCRMRMRHIPEDGIIDSPRKLFFNKIHSFKPVLFLQSVVHADMSSPLFFQRFDEEWRSFVARTEAFEETMKMGLINEEQLHFMNKFVEKSVMSAIACEGHNRREWISSYKTWDRYARNGKFEQFPISVRTLELVKAVWNGPNFTYGMDEQWLLLGWKEVILHGLSVWKPTERKHPDPARLTLRK